MKIVYLSAAVLPSEKSHSLSIMRVCQALTDAGHDVTLSGIAPHTGAPDPIAFYGLSGGFRILRSTMSRLWNNRVGRALHVPALVLALKTRRLVRDVQPDLIYSRLTLVELVLVPRKTTIVYEMHSLGPLAYTLDRVLFFWLMRHKTFRRIVVTTDAFAALLRARLPGIGIVVARLSAESPVAMPEQKLKNFRSTVLQGQAFSHHVGYTGYLDTVGLRGTDIICKAAAKMPHVAFHVVGGEPALVEHWRHYASEYNQAGNIFFYGYKAPSDIPLFLECLDVTLAPLQYRPIARAPIGMSPLKLPQYLAYGKAIVASDIPGHREMLTHDRTAPLVPCDDVAAWVDAIDRLIRDPEKRKSLAAHGRAAYRAEYTPQVRVRRILENIEHT